MEMPEWKEGDRGLWAMYLTFHDQPELHDVVTGYQDVLSAHSGLDLVHQDWLHMTVNGVGFTDEVAPSAIETLVSQISESMAAHPLPPLKVAGPMVDHDAISLLLSPTAEIVAIRAEIQALAGSVLHGAPLYRLPEPKVGFRPHISIAYANRDWTAEEIEPILAEIDVVDLTLRVSELSFIELRRTQRAWTWASERRLQLGPTSVLEEAV
jgi:2'-5' RNA ligase